MTLPIENSRPRTPEGHLYPVKSGTFFVQFLLFILAFVILYAVVYTRVVVGQYGLGGLGGVDAIEYDVMTRAILSGEGFSQVMFGLRPPLFPLFSAAVYRIGGHHLHLLLFFQAVIGATTVVLSYKIANRLLGNRLVAILTALLVSIDVAMIDATVSAMTEPLHNLLLLMGLYWSIDFLKGERRSSILLTALFMSLALLTRSVAVYFVGVLALIIVLVRPRQWKWAGLLVALCAIPVIAWSGRNLHYRDNFSMSTSGTFILTFYKAVSVESHATGQDPNDVATDIALEIERKMGNSTITREEIAEYPVGRVEDRVTLSKQREAISKRVALERFKQYPLWTVIMTGVALVRQFDAVPDAAVPAGIQYGLLGGEFLFGAAGYWLAWKQRKKLFLLFSHAVIGYYAGITALIFAGLYDSRYRTPYWPFVLMYTALGLAAVFHLVQKRGSRFN